MTARPPTPPEPTKRTHSLAMSFRFAFEGVRYFFRTQRNARIHVALAIPTCIVAAWLGLSRGDWAILIIAMASVTILEGVNTAIETVVDLASPEIHPLAKIAKDVSAAMVLLAAVAAVTVGLLLLGVPLWRRLVQPI